MNNKLVLVGGGGHCKVVIDMLVKEDKYEIVGITDIRNIGNTVFNVPIIGEDSILAEIFQNGVTNALITIGSVKNNEFRKQLYNKVKQLGFKLITVIHPQAIIGFNVKIEEGSVVLASSVINADTRIGSNCIINTGSIIEHECIIGDHVHISPGVKIAGGVSIGDKSFIGIGSTVIQGVNIGKNVTIGAGSVVINDIPDNVVALGVPAKIIKYKDDFYEKRY
jgi:UDP-perosamine 4-acetyltransferase